MTYIADGFKQLISGSQELAALGVTGVWAFFNLLLILYVAWLKRTSDKAAESAWAARIEEAKADGLIASAIDKMADEIKELRHIIGGNHV